MADQDSRTEAPTPRRLQQSREAGEAPLSREFVTFVVTAGVVTLLVYQGENLARRLAVRLTALFEGAHSLSAVHATAMALSALGWVVVPVFATICGLAALATFGQTRFLFTLSALQPKLSRIDPSARLSRLFGPAALAETLRALVKLAVVTFGAWLAISDVLRRTPAALSWTVIGLNTAIQHQLVALAIAVLTAFSLVAIIDIVIVHWRHHRKLRMTRQEIRDEHRDAEGDPLIKRKIRQIQQQRARRRMMAAVPKAIVVLTNPTHYAVALAYDRAKGGAPTVVAKGADEVAAKIREIATQSGVPLVANPPLTRALYKVDLGAEIPAEHYRIVAEVIAYVWRLRGQPAGGR